ncbi:hypothetical protein OAH87_03720 [Marinomonas sp.]|nr:hypothetical protein [Marinomonas sp.]MDB4837556.1 hypothetical protein [Marinomonas sp.]
MTHTQEKNIEENVYSDIPLAQLNHRIVDIVFSGGKPSILEISQQSDTLILSTQE